MEERPDDICRCCGHARDLHAAYRGVDRVTYLDCPPGGAVTADQFDPIPEAARVRHVEHCVGCGSVLRCLDAIIGACGVCRADVGED